MKIEKFPLIVAITGASGAILGIRTLELLEEAGIETHLVVSRAARLTIASETSFTLDEVYARAAAVSEPEEFTSPVASGSFPTRGMIIAPCSIKTLSAVANSYSSDLITRAADVCLKENRPLLLAVRETPLHTGHLRLMEQAASLGAVIFPPVPAFYAQPQSIDDLVTSLAARMLARVGIETGRYERWGGKGHHPG